MHQLVLAAAIGCGGAALILLAGTRFLSWYWLVLVIAVSLGAALYLWRKRFPSMYGVAQRIDAELKLADTLSTAVYFQESPGSADATIREGQHRQAEHLAESVDLKRALPFRRPRALYPAVGLALAVVAIFLMRYAVLGSFDPRTSLVASAYDSFFGAPKQQAQQFAGSPEDGSKPGNGNEQKNQADKNSDFAGDPSGKFDPTSPSETKQQQDSQQAENKDQQGDGQKKQDSPSANQMQQQEGNQNSPGDNQQPSGNQNAKASQDPSLINKLREALSDMLNKMKSSPSESAQNQKGEPQNQSEQPGQQGQAQENGESQEAQNGQQSADPQNQGNNGKSKPSEQQQSGIGSQEGDKSAKQAEALKAMGKITELLGKRAENVKGAVMVEVGSTKQQLKTPVLQGQSTHAEAGSEIHRDEVPPMYENFVQQYFEQIRKPQQP
jgi:hypothetical protein